MQVKLGDFGMSKILQSKSMTISMFGTPNYHAPEIINGDMYKFESDIWSLGILLYEMSALRYPFQGKDISHIYKAIDKGEFDQLPTQFSKDLNNIIKKCLKKDPKKRPTITDILNHPSVL